MAAWDKDLDPAPIGAGSPRPAWERDLDPPAAGDGRRAKIDAYLAETDKVLGLPEGTSSRQINQESRYRSDAVSPAGARGLAQVMAATAAKSPGDAAGNPASMTSTSRRASWRATSSFSDAVSPAGARGLAQVMPATVDSLSKRLGRKLDPANDDDALLMHRELMRENLKRFGSPEDAPRPGRRHHPDHRRRQDPGGVGQRWRSASFLAPPKDYHVPPPPRLRAHLSPRHHRRRPGPPPLS